MWGDFRIGTGPLLKEVRPLVVGIFRLFLLCASVADGCIDCLRSRSDRLVPIDKSQLVFGAGMLDRNSSIRIVVVSRMVSSLLLLVLLWHVL